MTFRPYFVLLLFCFVECQGPAKRDQQGYFIFQSIGKDSVEEYIELLGQISVQSKEYDVFNLFRRIHAAELWHGQSQLIFAGMADTVAYLLEDNTDFPDGVVNHQLHFPGNRVVRLDSLPPLLCIPAGCVQKEDAVQSDVLNGLKIDSIRAVFKGGYAP